MSISTSFAELVNVNADVISQSEQNLQISKSNIPAPIITIEGNTTYLEEPITDEEGIVTQPDGTLTQTSANRNGVTKVVKRGNGSWDIYISRSFWNKYEGSISLIAGALGASGLGAPLAFTIVSMASGIMGTFGNFPGVVVQVRKWIPTNVYRQ